MDIRSKHLSSEDRGVILAEHNRGSSQRLIGQLLHRPASMICRELARGRQEDGSYCPQAARQAYIGVPKRLGKDGEWLFFGLVV